MERKINDGCFLKLAKSRKTTYEFSDKQVNDFDLKRILEAGRWAPSCSNMQPWHFIIVKDKNRIKQLMMTANYGDFHTDPSLIIAFVMLRDKCHGNSCFRGAHSDIYDGFISVGMAALLATLEARYLGIDSCLLTTKQSDAKRILKIKKNDLVPLVVGFGYQSKNAFQKKRERNELTEITSYEFFGGRK